MLLHAKSYVTLRRYYIALVTCYLIFLNFIGFTFGSIGNVNPITSSLTSLVVKISGKV